MLRSFQSKESLPYRILLTILLAPFLLFAGCTKPTDLGKADGGTSTGAKEAVKKLETGRAVLDAMAAAYRKAKTYQDNGTLRLTAQSGENKSDEVLDFSVAFERPNKVHLDIYNSHVRSDGQKYFAFIKDMPDQIVEKDAPEKFNLKSLYNDPILIQNISMGGPASAPPQPLLLLENKALGFLLSGAEEPILSEPGEIQGRKCHRVQIRRPEGGEVFWIDQESFILRRIVFATDALRSYFAQKFGGEVENISLIAEFTDAQFDQTVQPTAFQFEVPQGVQIGKYFVPSHPGKWIGKKTPNFKFTDEAGQSITPQSLSGKFAVLLFWSLQSGDCKKSLADLQKISDAYKSEKNVVIGSVCLEGEMLDKKAMEDLRRTENLHLPIYRDTEKGDPDFKLIDVVYFLGADGTVQDYQLVADADLPPILQKKIESLLAGQSLAEDSAKRFEKELKDYAKAVEDFAAADNQAAPEPKIAERSAPKTFKLRSLWKCSDVNAPGNILVLQEPKREPKLLVVSPPNMVAEVGLDGKVGKVHKLDLTEDELIANLRSFTTTAGKTYVAAFAGLHQRLHFFDLEEKVRISYPQDALTNRHSGIADVELCDLDSDGAPEIYVGFWGVVGVHRVALDGNRMWGNHSLANVARLVAGPPVPLDKSGKSQRKLICLNILTEDNSSLVVLDAQGKRAGELTVGKRNLRSLAAADLFGDGNPARALAEVKRGSLAAIGFELQPRDLGFSLPLPETWNCPLPEGVPTRPIEPIVPGRISPQGPGQWILPGPDGSIQILSAEGKPLDSFNSGVILQGMATVEIGGKPALLIASPDGLEAFAVE